MTLTPDPKNARRHTTRNQLLIRQSLQELGPFRSIAVDGDNIVRAGNGVYEQAQALGLKVRIIEALPDELIAVKRADLRGAAAERAALYDNQTVDLSEWDGNILAEIAEQTPEVVEDIFAPGEIDAIIEEALALNRIEQAAKESQPGGEPEGSQDMEPGDLRIRPVIYARELATFERALRLTGLEDRGAALLYICQAYIDQAQHAV
ncbi:MAG: hypothetical protein EOM66_09525 [Clostridia bacterium]|nr:hypothetical protein [Clostridia bacterium]